MPKPKRPPAPPPVSSPAPAPFTGSAELIFSDEFEGNSLDLTKWTPNWLSWENDAITAPVSTQESAAYVPAQVSVSGGNCVLSVVADPVTVGGKTYPYRSGMIQTDRKFNAAPTAGRPLIFEARIWFDAAAPGVIANFPAMWSNGQPEWPANGEIDVVEGLGPAPAGNAASHFHYPGGSLGSASPSGDNTGWHTWSVQWTLGDKLEFARDGVIYATFTPRGAGYVQALSAAHFFIFNLGVRATVGGPDKVPSEMRIDYVRVWRKL